MKREQIPQDLIYPSVEMQVLGQANPAVENKSKQGLEVLPVREVICPKCGSKNCWKRGNRRSGTKEYSCKDCNKFFIVYPLIDEERREIKCSYCYSRNYTLGGSIRGKQRYQCKNCNRKYVLNPYNRDNSDCLNNINCRWCGSNNFTFIKLSKAGKEQCKCKDCQRQFTVGAERPDILIAPQEFNFDSDVWTSDHLGYEKGIHKHNKLNFSYIQQPWLKYYFKKFILYLSSTRLSFSTLLGKVGYIKIFSNFLTKISYSQEFKSINRALIVEAIFGIFKVTSLGIPLALV